MLRRTNLFCAALLALAGVGIVGCQSSPPLTVELQQAPLVRSANGRTFIAVDFVVRQPDRTPLEPSEVDVVLSVDGRPLDVESLLTTKDERLSVDLNLHIVLDASYSMLSQPLSGSNESTAFDLMLTTAASSRDEITDIWAAKSDKSLVTTGLIFFDDWIYHTQGTWTSADIGDFPPPVEGTATRLLGAVHYSATEMTKQYHDGVAARPRDRHVMIVFTDGKDNNSTLDSTTNLENPCPGFCSAPTKPVCQDGTLVPSCPGKIEGICHTPETSAAYLSYGYPCVDRTAIREVMLAHPTLKAHIMGLGNEVDDDELTYLANQGGGTFVQGGTADDIPGLFSEVVKEFVTVNSQGADIPQPSGSYQFSLEIREKKEPFGVARCSFGYSNAPDSVGDLVSQIGECTPWPDQ